MQGESSLVGSRSARSALSLVIAAAATMTLSTPAWSAPSETQGPPVPAGVSGLGTAAVPLVRSTDGPPADVTPEQAADADAAQYAAEHQLPLARARTALARAAGLSDALAELEHAYPESFAGGWIEHDPDVRAEARFAGEVPAGAAGMVSDVAPAISLRGGAPRSVAALEQAADEVHRSLQAPGRTVATTYDIRTDRIELSVSRRPEEAGVPDDVLRSRLPARARAADVDVRLLSVPAGGGHHTRGGAVTPGDAGGYCTTGFTVTGGGAYGFNTAGHCANSRDYQEPETGLRYNAPYVTGHRGDWGDFQWHTTGHNEYAQFYVSNTGYRDVFGADTSLYTGDYVCKYGRRAGYDCTYIYRTSVYVTFDGITHERLVATRGDVVEPGDSGGPWFLSNNAMGVTSGWWQETSTTQRSTFSRIGYQDEALGLSLLVR